MKLLARLWDRIRGRKRLTVLSMESARLSDGEACVMFDASTPFDTGGK